MIRAGCALAQDARLLLLAGPGVVALGWLDPVALSLWFRAAFTYLPATLIQTVACGNTDSSVDQMIRLMPFKSAGMQ